jgi:hypothetical protein
MRWLWVVLLLCMVSVAVAAPIINQRGTSQVWLTIATNFANGAAVIGSAITPTSTGYQLAECIFDGPVWGGNVAAQGGMAVWVCTEIAGVYEDCDVTTLSPRRPDAVFPLRAGTNGQQRVKQTLLMPPGPFKALMQNVSGVQLSGATTAATLTCQPYTPGS